jgi:KDO2-lipid IV(A) lauroyltransferase
MSPLAYRLAARLAQALPASVAYVLARAVAACFWAWSPGRRAAVQANLRRVRPEDSAAQLRAGARRLFANFAESLVDTWRLSTDPAATRAACTVDGVEHVHAALAEGRGVLLWSAHLGNWELAAAALVREGLPVSALARPHARAGVDRFFAERRSRAGVSIVGRCPGSRAARLVLRSRGLLALLGDRGFGGGGRSVPLFGGAARLPAAPLALAHGTGAALVPGYVVRVAPGRYRVTVEPPLESAGEAALPALAATLERWVRAYPEQWFVFERLWDEARTEGA